MQITYKETKDIPFSELDKLIQSVGWGNRGDKWHEVIKASSYLVTAWENEKIIGLGRIVDDSVMCMVYDVAVHPEYQSNKIGSEIMNRLMAYIKQNNFQSIGLFAWNKNPMNISFYKKFGFNQVDFGMKFISN